MSRRLSVSVPTRICSSSASNIIRDNGNLVLASGGFMTRISRRGRPAADKDFPIITPTTSDWNIRVVLEGLDAVRVRSEAINAGHNGEADILLCFPRPSPSSPQKNQALGLFYVGEAARQFYGFRVLYWDARHDEEADFMALASKANVVGFSAITGFQLGEFVRLAGK